MGLQSCAGRVEDDGMSLECVNAANLLTSAIGKHQTEQRKNL